MQLFLVEIGSTQVNRDFWMHLSPGIPGLRTLLEKMKLMLICQITHLVSLAVLLDFAGKQCLQCFISYSNVLSMVLPYVLCSLAAFAVDDPEAWHYTSRPNLPAARQEHDNLVALLRQAGSEVVYHDESQPEHADAIYVFDPAIVTDHGAIILSMGKPQRRGEEAAMARCLEALGVPILYTLHGEARAEGGDLLWLDHDTLAVGQGFRTNAEGLQQLRESLDEIGVRVLPVELPYYTGSEACLHLLSLI